MNQTKSRTKIPEQENVLYCGNFNRTKKVSTVNLESGIYLLKG